MRDQEYLLRAIEIGKSVAREFSNKTRTEVSDFESVVNSKIPLVISKIDGDQNPDSFIRKSLSGYCMNYIRDNLSIIKLPREVTTAYLKNRKFNQEGSGSYNTSVEVNNLVSTAELNDYSEFLSSSCDSDPAMEALMSLKAAQRKLLIDFYVKKLQPSTMCRYYGSFYQQKVKEAVSELRELSEA